MLRGPFDKPRAGAPSAHGVVRRPGRAGSSDTAQAQRAARELAALRQTRSKLTVTIARRELRKWLRESEHGKAVDC